MNGGHPRARSLSSPRAASETLSNSSHLAGQAHGDHAVLFLNDRAPLSAAVPTNAGLSRDDRSLVFSDSSAPVPALSATQRATIPPPCRTREVQRPRDLPTELSFFTCSQTAEDTVSTEETEASTLVQQTADPSRGWCCGWLALILLGPSLCVNAIFALHERDLLRVWWWSLDADGLDRRGPQLEAVVKHPFTADSDEDGIPDQHDFCPNRCKSSDERHCSLGRWVSGKATDFDNDGCQDGVEDIDKDNDGVRDSEDRCPYTPIMYAFVSNAISDFDGDGCADGLEDTDNDGDNILNANDHCPRTRLGKVTDGSGCSADELASGKKEKDQRWWETVPRFGAEQRTTQKEQLVEEDHSWSAWIHGWLVELKGAWAEVFVGAILTATLNRFNRVLTKMQHRLPSTPTSSFTRRIASATIAGSRN